MSKTIAGLILIAGPIVAFLGAELSAYANNSPSTPDTDWFYSLINFCGAAIILFGLGMFFCGALRFAKKEA